MPKTEPFEKYFDQYEDWFVQNQYAYRSKFYALRYTQTIFQMLDQIKKPEEVKEGYGEGSFVVVSGIKWNLIL